MKSGPLARSLTLLLAGINPAFLSFLLILAAKMTFFWQRFHRGMRGLAGHSG